MKTDLAHRFYRYHRDHNTFRNGQKVLVALSGGKDSVCLLTLLLQTKERFGITIGACHVDHMMRSDSGNDLEFCKGLCKKESVPFFSHRADVPKFCEEGKFGPEEGARILRYRLLYETAEKEGYDVIATAHSATDQAETVLFRLTRGCGIRGAAGIPEKRDVLVRPLLPFYEEEILEYLHNSHISFTVDSSNADTIYSRNRIRREIFPTLRSINPASAKAFVQFAKENAWQEALCDAVTEKWLKKNQIRTESGILPFLPMKELAESEAGFPVLFKVFSKTAEKEKVNLDFESFSQLIGLLKNPREGKIIEIEKGFSFTKDNENLVFKKYEKEDDVIEYKVSLSVGTNEIPVGSQQITVGLRSRSLPLNVNKKSLIIHLNSDMIEGELFARNIRHGDRIRMNNMAKSVKKLLCDGKVPLRYRNKIPVVCDDKEIIWLPFFGLCDKVRSDREVNTVSLSLTGKIPEEIQNLIL